MYKVNWEMVQVILDTMPEAKKQVLKRALDRNSILTSARVLENGILRIYKEGWLLTLEGTRCSFSVFAKDNDGELEFIRKPSENKLHKLYEQCFKMSESDYLIWEGII